MGRPSLALPIQMLNKQELRERGLILEAQATSFRGGEIELEVIGREPNSVRGYDRCTIVLFGTLFCGLRVDARLSEVRENRLVMNQPATSYYLSASAETKYWHLYFDSRIREKEKLSASSA